MLFERIDCEGKREALVYTIEYEQDNNFKSRILRTQNSRMNKKHYTSEIKFYIVIRFG